MRKAQKSLTKKILAIAITTLLASSLSSCSTPFPKPPKKKEPTCRDYQLKYDYHNGEATLWDARGDRQKAEAEMMEVVKVVMNNYGCFPEKIIQDIQFYYTTLPGVTKNDTPTDQPTSSPTS